MCKEISQNKNMRKLITLFFSIIMVQGLCAQTMSDKQVLDYTKSGLEQGKDQKVIASELARRGVTKEQAIRVKQMYDREQQAKDAVDSTQTTDDRARTVGGNTLVVPEAAAMSEVEGSESGISGSSNRVYGREIFNTRNLTFEPSVNLATPQDYRLGPGDEVIIDIWGTNQTTIRQTISPEGYITINDIGLVSLNGKTIESATSYLRKELNKIYTGLDGEEATSNIMVSLGNIRTIQVNVMGEVRLPGTYRLSSFSTVFHALYRAGGVNGIGSLRAVNIMRSGKNIATVDVYDFIMEGKIVDDIRLQEGDVVIVPPYEALVTISGKIKRPMTYEMKKDETMATLIKYAGGFTSDAYTLSVRTIRQNGKEYQVNMVDEFDYSAFKMQDGDVVITEPILTRYENKLEVKGAVYRPGIYAYNDELNTVRSLVLKAEGLMGDAFTGRAVLYRERENLTQEVIQVDIAGIMGGTTADIPLKPNDVLYIPSIHDLTDLGKITVNGHVANPGDIAYADNMTLEDAIIQSGGLRDGASTVRVDVSRRVKDQKATKTSETIAEYFTFSLKDGFVVEGTPGFILQPYDQIYVRRSPGYFEQHNVSISGEVLYSGTYTLTTKNERISDLVNKAGGLTKHAYAKGAKLVRQANPEEMQLMQETINMMRREFGEGKIDSMDLQVKTTYTVGIDLEKAMADPGGDDDLILRVGDQLEVTEVMNTVKIDGAVMRPNTVTHKKGMRVKDYIKEAGGYSQHAKKSKTFVIFANGHIEEASNSKKQIQPGCEIVVPTKIKSNPVRLQTIMSVAQSLGSLGLTAASLANILK